ncbi:hypothetical protein SAMN05444373_1001109 [Thermoclostridium caenicola]|uniref:Uncharacterized protein n=2 Tax=Thermoclostridium caenicola TaxID=659425 RepID=A0A1M6ANT1_9FIRM|nr:hypothetical protein SAMN05444373_1001109 [Thermoclostridium caenicola]
MLNLCKVLHGATLVFMHHPEQVTCILQAAFWTFAAYSFLAAFLNDIEGIQWADMTTGTFIGFILALTVFAIRCIITDRKQTKTE